MTRALKLHSYGEQKQYYKAVRELGDLSLVSACSHDLMEYYSVDQWTAGEYPLFMFSTLGFAQSFVTEFGARNLWVYECDAENPRQINVRLTTGCLISPVDEQYLQAFWRGEIADGYELCDVPPGTLVADRIRLTKRIDWKPL